MPGGLCLVCRRRQPCVSIMGPIIHVLSNWKWTERSEPSALLARAQQAAGADVHYICGRGPPGVAGTVADRVRAMGLPVTEMELPKHVGWTTIWRSVRELRRHVDTIRPGVMHVHMSNAHLVAVLAMRACARMPLLIRSCYDPDGWELGRRERWLGRALTGGVVVINARARRHLVDHLGLDPERVALIEPGIDLDRFDPAARSPVAGRERWQLPADAFVIGMVTRIRLARRTDLGVKLIHALRTELPQCRLLLIGRGSAREVRRAVSEPAAYLGVSDRIIMAGYQVGEDLVAAYRAMDVLLYPLAGTDRSCRTVREAMAAGVPVLAGRSGFLPDLVADGVTGYLSDLSPEELAVMVRQLATNPEVLKKMADAARGTACARFRLADQALRCMAFYQKLSTRLHSVG